MPSGRATAPSGQSPNQFTIKAAFTTQSGQQVGRHPAWRPADDPFNKPLLRYRRPALVRACEGNSAVGRHRTRRLAYLMLPRIVAGSVFVFLHTAGCLRPPTCLRTGLCLDGQQACDDVQHRTGSWGRQRSRRIRHWRSVLQPSKASVRPGAASVRARAALMPLDAPMMTIVSKSTSRSATGDGADE